MNRLLGILIILTVLFYACKKEELNDFYNTNNNSAYLSLKSFSIPDTANITSDTSIRAFCDQIVYLDVTTDSAISYAWFNSTDINSIDSTPILIDSFGDNYRVHIELPSSTKIIRILSYRDGGIYIPNSFTPNGDGINDVLKVEGCSIMTFSFRIYNLDGQKLFESNDFNAGWDGINSRRNAPQGVYVYDLDGQLRNSTELQIKGNIQLLR